jgi:hypothetical protein
MIHFFLFYHLVKVGVWGKILFGSLCNVGEAFNGLAFFAVWPSLAL